MADLSLMRLIDHTLLKPYSTLEDVRRVFNEAVSFGCHSICVNPVYVSLARSLVDDAGADLKVCSVIDFPFGSMDTESRVQAIVRAAANGADEVDVVAPITLVKSSRWAEVARDLRRVVRAAHGEGLVIKVVVEDAYTTRDEKLKLYETVATSGADFIKTSTGFEDREYASSIGNMPGAQADNVRLMAEVANRYNPSLGIKAAGGIRTLRQVQELLEASGRPPDPSRFRIGTSAAASIWRDLSSGRT
jgi:deoxyribose-phosphate aldolase